MISNDEAALANTQVRYLSSAHVADEFRIIVGGCEDAPAGVGVLVVLDAFFLRAKPSAPVQNQFEVPGDVPVAGCTV